jgi:hypothetical protein
VNSTICRAADEDTPTFPNFNSFETAFVTLFRVGTFDHFGDALWHTQNAAGTSMRGFPVYFLYVTFIVVGPCIVSNVCIAAMIKNFSVANEAAQKDEKTREEKLARMALQGGSSVGVLLCLLSQQVIACFPINPTQPPPPLPGHY